MSLEPNLQADFDPAKSYLNIQHNELLVGRAAVGMAIESGIHPADIHTLCEVLVNHSIPIPEAQKNSQSKEWTREETIEQSAWLATELSDVRKKLRNQKVINEKIIRRAAYMGLMPSPRQIRHERLFGSLSQLYKDTNLYDAHKLYTNLSDQELKEYVQSLVKELGRLPTVKEVRERSMQDTTNPNYETIYKRLGGILKATDETEHKKLRNWSPKKCTNWGVAFFIANNRLPTQSDIDMMSARRLSMSASSIERRFGGSLTEFKNSVIESFSRMNEVPGYRQKFFKVKNGGFEPRDWVAALRIETEMQDGLKADPADSQAHGQESGQLVADV